MTADMTSNGPGGGASSIPPVAGTGGLERWWLRLLPSGADVLFMSIAYVALRLGANLTHRDGDLGRHIRLGRSVIDDGVIPQVDIYSHTMAGGHMVPHEWISQTVFAGTERIFGFDGIGLLTAMVAAAPWALLYRWMIKRGHRIGTALGLSLLGAGASMIHWAARPHIFTWLFIVAWVIFLEDHRTGQRDRMWWLVPLMVLWANTHGAFIVGLILIATYLAGRLLEVRDIRDERIRHLGIILLGCFLAALANPDGLTTVINGFSYTGEEFLLSFTREYNSPDFHNLLFWPFLGLILLTVVVPIKWSATRLLLVVSWTGFALYSFRNIPIYAIVVVPILASGIDAWLDQRSRPYPLSDRMRGYAATERIAHGGPLAAAFVVLIALNLGSTAGSAYEFDEGYFPVAALRDLGDQPPGERVFNEFRWGGYIEYCCHPAIPVFIDGQTDYYGPDLTMDYDRAVEGKPGWQEVLDGYDVDWVLIAPEDALAQILTESDDWVEIYRDGTAITFARSSR